MATEGQVKFQSFTFTELHGKIELWGFTEQKQIREKYKKNI